MPICDLGRGCPVYPDFGGEHLLRIRKIIWGNRGDVFSDLRQERMRRALLAGLGGLPGPIRACFAGPFFAGGATCVRGATAGERRRGGRARLIFFACVEMGVLTSALSPMSPWSKGGLALNEFEKLA